jgi:uncharacterized phiE125 gp8 family phage protein
MSGSYLIGGAGLNQFAYSYGQYGTYWGAYYGILSPYGTLRLTESSPPQSLVEPCTVKEIRSYLKIPERLPADTDEDLFLGSLISAAREQAEILQGRDIVQKQWDLSFDYWTSYRIETRAPLQTVDLVQYTNSDGNLIVLNPLTDYMIDNAKEPGIIYPPYNGTWPTFTPQPSSAILLRFTSGYPATHPWWYGSGQRIKNGMKLLISAWYNNRMPFEKGLSAAAEYPYAVSSCLSYGSMVRAR